MASRYGVPERSALSDWPIDYDELEPYYSRAEWEVGVSGDATGDSAHGPRSRDYPMPPLAGTRASRVLAAGAQAFLDKPVSGDTIAYHLEAALRRS